MFWSGLRRQTRANEFVEAKLNVGSRLTVSADAEVSLEIELPFLAE